MATSAVRDAENAAEFMTAASEATGVNPEVLSGDEEGRLSFAGATAHLPDDMKATDPVLVVDIGGGSTKLVVGRPGAADASDVAIRSLDMGCVRVTERFFHHDPPTQAELTSARMAVYQLMESARNHLPALSLGGHLIGLAGTVSTLACLEQGLVAYERERIHHAVLSRDTVERWLDVLAHEASFERAARTGMVEGREDVIVGGVLILAVVMETFVRSSCMVSEDDILDGMAAGLLSPRSFATSSESEARAIEVT